MFEHILGIPAYYPNLVLVSFLFLFTVNPFRICYYRARFWLLRVLVSLKKVKTYKLVVLFASTAFVDREIMSRFLA